MGGRGRQTDTTQNFPILVSIKKNSFNKKYFSFNNNFSFNKK